MISHFIHSSFNYRVHWDNIIIGTNTAAINGTHFFLGSEFTISVNLMLQYFQLVTYSMSQTFPYKFICVFSGLSLTNHLNNKNQTIVHHFDISAVFLMVPLIFQDKN